MVLVANLIKPTVCTHVCIIRMGFPPLGQGDVEGGGIRMRSLIQYNALVSLESAETIYTGLGWLCFLFSDFKRTFA
jgi:hypothetical protein